MLVVTKAVVILRVINLKSKIAEARDDVAANFGVAFANRGGEDERVNTLHRGNHFANSALDAVNIHIIGQLRPRIVISA